jgi:E3 ubiquitin-protein ligase AIP2
VCREDFAEGDRLIKMPCSVQHVFHAKCVQTWLKRDDSCPMCRVSLPVWLGRPQYA